MWSGWCCPTVVEPLRADWANAQAAALLLANEANSLEGKKREDKLAEARAEVRRFHHLLCTTRILDPACGSGNFLYVTLEHLKRLEGEVVNQLEALGDALLNRKRVRFSYHTMESDTRTARLVEPWGLFWANAHWYLAGCDTDKDAVRNFRVSRIAGVAPENNRAATPDFAIPPGWSSATWWATSPG